MRASLELDGQLSQVEQALQRAHVGCCAECAAFVLDVGGLTKEIRATPLSRPSRAGLSARRRSSGTRALRVGAVAAAVAIAAGLGSLAGSLSSRRPPHQSAEHRFAPALFRIASGSSVAHPPRTGTRLPTSTPV
jgi:hypothetical protein